jgi:hypothetical protein
MDEDFPEGVPLGVLNFPEWKHKILKFVAHLLFLKRTKYVILVHTIKTKDDDGRRPGPDISQS